MSHLFVCCVGVYLLYPAGEAELSTSESRVSSASMFPTVRISSRTGRNFDDSGLYSDALHPLRTKRDRRQVWFRSWCCLSHSFREPKGGTMPRLSAGQEKTNERCGEDDSRAACPRVAHSSPPIKRSIAASAVCSSNSS